MFLYFPMGGALCGKKKDCRIYHVVVNEFKGCFQDLSPVAPEVIKIKILRTFLR